jgi:tetratricopeptide (TPR) repeat protein
VEGGRWCIERSYVGAQGAVLKQLAVLLASLVLLSGAFYLLTMVRGKQPPEVRLGFYPPAPVTKALSADYHHFVSQVILLNCIFYYGTMVELRETPNWNRIYEALYTSAHLDPYNMDTYYMAQAVLPWEARSVRPTIELLEYGFAHRNWDWYLPLFLSFDYAYFLRDYEKAGQYMAKTAALNKKAGYFYTLSARYLYEAGRTALALAYLRELIPSERNEHIKSMMITRAQALEGILTLEKAVAAFKERYHRLPRDLEEVKRAGFLPEMPVDPYGGTFYLDQRGRVRTTSKLAYGERNGKK